MIFKVPLSGGGLILPLSIPQELSREFRVHWRGGRVRSAQAGLRWSPGPMNSFFNISWRVITLQYCSGFCHTLTWISHGSTCVPHSDPPSRLPPHPIPLGLPSAPAPSTCLLHPTGDLFHPWYYTCFSYSLRTSHPHLLPQSLQVCCVHLCLFFCFAYRVIVTIFLNSIYMH